MNIKKISHFLIIFSLILVLVSACSNNSVEADGTTSAVSSAPQVSISHSNDTEPDNDLVFPDDTVNEIVIRITSDNWQAVNEDMEAKYGEFGSGDGMGAGGAKPGGAGNQPENAPDMNNLPQNRQAPPAGVPQAGEDRVDGEFALPDDVGADRPQRDNAGMQDRSGIGGGGMMGGDDDDNPIWVDATIEFGDETWEHVGFRLKGNSSLKSSWSSGSYKLPFKLDFDEFEDDYTETENQRFYGFKQLTFSSNFSDTSYLKEKIAADIFRDAGIPSAQTAFYAVYVDYGEGPLYFGLYTAVEVVDDTLIQTQFEDDSGNVYKPSGAAATFAVGTYNEEQYDKETNQDQADYSDLQALLEALHSTLRLTDAQAWRTQLESVFDVDNFLQWLAVNSVMQNWDTYGSMAHNYYLYHDPASDQLVWIPWDNTTNPSAAAGGGAEGGGRLPNGASTSASIGNEEVGENRPLISYLLADEVYWQKYVQSVENVVADVFTPQALAPVIQDLHDLVTPYVKAEMESTAGLAKTNAFNASAESLITHINQRYQAALEFLAENQ